MALTQAKVFDTELKHAHEDINAQRKQLAEAQQVAGDSREAAAKLEGELSALRS